MELEQLYNKTLIEIHRVHKKVELVFQGNSNRYRLKFEGFIFETELSPMDQKICKIKSTSSIGIKAMEALRFYNIFEKENYKQVLIQFDDSFYKKNEIIIVFKEYDLV